MKTQDFINIIQEPYSSTQLRLSLINAITFSNSNLALLCSISKISDLCTFVLSRIIDHKPK